MLCTEETRFSSLSAVANCGSSNLWETRESRRARGGKEKVARLMTDPRQCKDCVSVYK